MLIFWTISRIVIILAFDLLCIRLGSKSDLANKGFLDAIDQWLEYLAKPQQRANSNFASYYFSGRSSGGSHFTKDNQQEPISNGLTGC